MHDDIMVFRARKALFVVSHSVGKLWILHDLVLDCWEVVVPDAVVLIRDLNLRQALLTPVHSNPAANCANNLCLLLNGCDGSAAIALSSG